MFFEKKNLGFLLASISIGVVVIISYVLTVIILRDPAIPNWLGWIIATVGCLAWYAAYCFYREGKADGEIKGWSDAYEVNGKRYSVGCSWQGWTFRDGTNPCLNREDPKES